MVARWRRALLSALLAAIVGVGLVGVGSASGGSIEGRVVGVPHTRWERVRGSYLVGGSRYVFIGRGRIPYTNGGGVLVDGRTGHSRNISTPGCRAVAVGAPWVAFSCGDPQTFELYNIPAGRFEAFTGVAAYLDCVRDCLPIAAVGAHWVAFVVPPLNYHDYPAFAFQNLQTSPVLEDDPASSTTSLDLNSPQLAQSVCRPLTLPPVVSAVGSGWGSLTFLDDGFAVASGNDGAYLERCGSHLHEFLTQTRAVDGESSYLCPYLVCPPVNNSREIVWPAGASLAFGPRGITGIFLPSRERFAIPVPAKVLAAGILPLGLALTPTRLYVSTNDGIFTTKAPTGPSKSNRG
jgi:hypothetical protein